LVTCQFSADRFSVAISVFVFYSEVRIVVKIYVVPDF